MQLAVDLPPPTDDKRVVLQEETALEWLQRLGCDMALLHTGHAELDRLKLFKNGALTEIVGEDATGKMQLGMTVIAELLLSYRKQNVAVYVIDFNGSFRMNRLAQILSTHSADPSVSCAHLLDRINYSRTRDCVQLEQRLLELEDISRSGYWAL